VELLPFSMLDLLIFYIQRRDSAGLAREILMTTWRKSRNLLDRYPSRLSLRPEIPGPSQKATAHFSAGFVFTNGRTTKLRMGLGMTRRSSNLRTQFAKLRNCRQRDAVAPVGSDPGAISCKAILNPGSLSSDSKNASAAIFKLHAQTGAACRQDRRREPALDTPTGFLSGYLG
jgi:hypothetical protein